jgi:GNAT superfamily N-acetyltransferase
MTAGWRVATEADVAELVRVINLAYRVEDFFIDGDRTDAAGVLERMRRPAAEFLVVDAGEPGRLAAVVYLEQRGERGYFGMLSVDPTVQRRGLGRRLVAAAEARCRERGCVALDLDVVDLRLELPAYYAALGFQPAGTAPFKDVHKLKRPAVMLLMSKPLVG